MSYSSDLEILTPTASMKGRPDQIFSSFKSSSMRPEQSKTHQVLDFFGSARGFSDVFKQTAERGKKEEELGEEGTCMFLLGWVLLCLLKFSFQVQNFSFLELFSLSFTQIIAVVHPIKIYKLGNFCQAKLNVSATLPSGDAPSIRRKSIGQIIRYFIMKCMTIKTIISILILKSLWQCFPRLV